jgi:hypothetical protein
LSGGLLTCAGAAHRWAPGVILSVFLAGITTRRPNHWLTQPRQGLSSAFEDLVADFLLELVAELRRDLTARLLRRMLLLILKPALLERRLVG